MSSVPAKKKKKDAFAFADPVAEKMMTKHGWKRGKGLGSSMTGDAEFGIVVKRKYSKTGLGDEPGKDYENEWWHQVYKKASNNISSKSSTEEVKTTDHIKKPLEFKKPILKNGIPFVPVKFVKCGTLVNEEIVEEKTTSPEQEEKKVEESTLGPSFDEQFKACNGLTIHKGGRYGITYKGKLDRLKAQEEEAQMKILSQTICIKDEGAVQVKSEKVDEKPKIKVEKKKKKKKSKTKNQKKENCDENDENLLEIEQQNLDVDSTEVKQPESSNEQEGAVEVKSEEVDEKSKVKVEKNKKKKKSKTKNQKKENCDENDKNLLETEQQIPDVDSTEIKQPESSNEQDGEKKKKKKKAKKRKLEENVEEKEVQEDNVEIKKKKKKKKKVKNVETS